MILPEHSIAPGKLVVFFPGECVVRDVHLVAAPLREALRHGLAQKLEIGRGVTVDVLETA
jgi:hypothetical protein